MRRSLIKNESRSVQSSPLTSLFFSLLLLSLTSASVSQPAGAVTHSKGYGVGITRCTFIDATREVLNYATTPPTVLSHSRSLITEIRYPISFTVPGASEQVNAVASNRPYGFPMIVFAHGYNVTPDTYAALLDAWTRRGFVVAAPIFPDENPVQVARQGGTNSSYDLWNEPADLVFVTRQLLSASTTTSQSCPIVKGLINAKQLALAGHSDGGTVVGMLALSSGRDPQGVTYPVLRKGLHYRAALVLSGKEDGISQYASIPSTPALLVVQSANDRCNAPSGALKLYQAMRQRNKWFLELLSAHHLPPFDGVDVRAFNMTVGVTTRFFHISLEGSTHLADLLAYGNSQMAVARIFHFEPGPVFSENTSPFNCGKS